MSGPLSDRQSPTNAAMLNSMCVYVCMCVFFPFSPPPKRPQCGLLPLVGLLGCALARDALVYSPASKHSPPLCVGEESKGPVKTSLDAGREPLISLAHSPQARDSCSSKAGQSTPAFPPPSRSPPGMFPLGRYFARFILSLLLFF